MPKEVTLARELKALGPALGIGVLSARQIRDMHIAENVDGAKRAYDAAVNPAEWSQQNSGAWETLDWAAKEYQKWLDESY